jgi:threonine dehydratase
MRRFDAIIISVGVGGLLGGVTSKLAIRQDAGGVLCAFNMDGSPKRAAKKEHVRCSAGGDPSSARD